MLLTGSGGKVAHNAFASILHQNAHPNQPIVYVKTQLVLYANPDVSVDVLRQAVVYVKGLAEIPEETRLQLLLWLNLALDPKSRESHNYGKALDDAHQQRRAGVVPGGWCTIALLVFVLISAVTTGMLLFIFGIHEVRTKRTRSVLFVLQH